MVNDAQKNLNALLLYTVGIEVQLYEILTDPGLVPVLQLKKIQLSASYLNLFANYYLITMYI